jgi:hypothetical protein
MRSRWLIGSAWATTVVAALLLGELRHGSRVPEDAGSAAPACRAARLPAAPPRSAPVTPSLEALRAVIREELDGAAPVEPAAAAAESPPSGDADAARAAVRLVDDRLAAGAWREEDRAALLVQLGRMGRAEADALLSTLFTALNEGRMHTTYPGTPI